MSAILKFEKSKLSKLHKNDPILHATTTFFLKQGGTRASSGPIPHPLNLSNLYSIWSKCFFFFFFTHLIYLGSQLGAFCPYAIVYCYLEFKLHYLKNLKLFSIRIKELFDPIVFRKKGNRFLLFLKAFSWETDLWVKLGDFKVKSAKLRREICI